MRHSAAHMMAAAVLELFPDAKLGIGPAIKDGFYYDFDLPRPLTPADLEQIETKMREQQAAVPAIRALARPAAGRGDRRLVSRAQPAVQGRDHRGPAANPRGRRSASTATAIFEDLCRGGTSAPRRTSAPSSCSTPPAPTGAATRRGRCSSASTARPGTRRSELDQHLWRIEEAKKRDHRKLGRELDLFSSTPSRRPRRSPSARHGAVAIAGGLVAPGPARGGLPRGPDPEPRPQGAVGDVRPLGQSTRTTCSSSTTTTTSPGLKPMNCPE